MNWDKYLRVRPKQDRLNVIMMLCKPIVSDDLCVSASESIKAALSCHSRILVRINSCMHLPRCGDHLTLQCMADITQKRFKDISVDAKNIVMPHNHVGSYETLVLAFLTERHYDAVVEWIDQDRGLAFNLSASHGLDCGELSRSRSLGHHSPETCVHSVLPNVEKNQRNTVLEKL